MFGQSTEVFLVWPIHWLFLANALKVYFFLCLFRPIQSTDFFFLWRHSAETVFFFSATPPRVLLGEPTGGCRGAGIRSEIWQSRATGLTDGELVRPGQRCPAGARGARGASGVRRARGGVSQGDQGGWGGVLGKGGRGRGARPSRVVFV